MDYKMEHSIDYLEQKAYKYRRRFLELFTSLGFGHVTSAFSWAEIATVLYNEIMCISSEDMFSLKNDKMVVSKGHGVGMLFPIFEDLGYFTKEEMEKTVRIGGDHTKLNKLFYPGFDFYGGSLGIGLGLAAGMAKGAKLSSMSWKTYCIVGDAECYEGSIWEAMNFAGHQKLDNLVVIVDRNSLGCSDFTEHMLKLEPFKDKWLSCNWDVLEIDGHNILDIYNALMYGKNSSKGKPVCIIANTKKGKGLRYLIDKPLMHGYVPKSNEEIEKAFRELE